MFKLLALFVQDASINEVHVHVLLPFYSYIISFKIQANLTLLIFSGTCDCLNFKDQFKARPLILNRKIIGCMDIFACCLISDLDSWT